MFVLKLLTLSFLFSPHHKTCIFFFHSYKKANILRSGTYVVLTPNIKLLLQ